MQSDALPAAGWYRDAVDPSLERWWDGTAWSEHTRPPAEPATPTAPAAPTGLSLAPAEPPQSKFAQYAAYCVAGGIFLPFLWVAAIVCGIAGLVEIQRSSVPMRGRGMAIAGIAFPIVLVTVAIVVIRLLSSPTTPPPVTPVAPNPVAPVTAPAAPSEQLPTDAGVGPEPANSPSAPIV